MKVVTKEIPIYHTKLTIVFSDDFKKAIEKLKLRFPGLDVSLYDAFASDQRTKSGRLHMYVFFKPDPTHSSIAHEVVHLVNFVFENCNIRPDLINDEPQAYLTGWITKQVYDALES